MINIDGWLVFLAGVLLGIAIGGFGGALVIHDMLERYMYEAGKKARTERSTGDGTPTT